MLSATGGGGGIGTEEQQDADSSSGIEASSSNTRCQSLVSYDLVSLAILPL